MRFAGGVTVTLVSRTASGQDSLGNDTFTTVQTVVQGAAWVPAGSSEDVQGRDLVVTQPMVYLPADAQIVNPIDAVIYNGVTYEVDGSPNYPVNPFTRWMPGIVIKLKAVTG